MIQIKNCEQIGTENLHHNIDTIRTRNESLYVQDELFKTNDGNFIILCHTITEGGMGAYYCQQAIFNNDTKQSLLINFPNFWTPNWIKNFNYFPKHKRYLTSVTCYDNITNNNPTPQILIDIIHQKFSLFSKDENIQLKTNKNWQNWNDKIDICKEYKLKNAM